MAIRISVNGKEHIIMEFSDLTRLSEILQEHIGSQPVKDAFDKFLNEAEESWK